MFAQKRLSNSSVHVRIKACIFPAFSSRMSFCPCLHDRSASFLLLHFLAATHFLLLLFSGFNFHLMLFIHLIKDRALCFIAPTAPQQGVFLGQFRAVTQIISTVRLNLQDDVQGLAEIGSVRQVRRWICVRWEIGRLCYACLHQRFTSVHTKAKWVLFSVVNFLSVLLWPSCLFMWSTLSCNAFMKNALRYIF